jgi:methylmalonyl-CoA mutase
MATPPAHDLSTTFPAVSYEEWRRRVVGEVGGEEAFEERLVTETLEGIRLEPLHTREHPGQEPLAVPPAAPGPWGLWLRFPDGAPEAAAEAVRRGKELEATGAWVTLDEAGRQGLDSDFEDASALVGRGGLALSTAADLEPLVARAHSKGIALGLEAGSQALPLAALTLAAAGAGEGRRLTGCLGADPLGALAAGEAVEIPSQLDEMASLALWSARHAPGLRAAQVATAPYHDAGADAVQELAFALATGVTYLRHLTAAGLELEEASGQITFVFEVGRGFHLQIAKLRAARALWAMALAAGAEGDGGAGARPAMRLHARTSWRTKSAYDCWSNLVRETVEAMAAILGGAQELTLRRFDEVAGAPGELGQRLALTTQLVLREEAQLHRVADPAAGSWSLEALTRELARGAWELFQRIESEGGTVAALSPGGAVERWVSEAATRRRRQIATGALPVVGVSAWANLQDPPPAPAQAEPSTELLASRRERLGRLRSRERSAAFDALDIVRRHRGRADAELVAALVGAARGGATLSQLVESLERPLPRSRGPSLPAWRDAEPFEGLRRAVDRHTRATSRRPVLLLVELGPHAELADSSAWVRRLLASVGLEGQELPGPRSPTEAMAAVSGRHPDAAVLVAPRLADPARVAIYSDALRHAGCTLVGATGRPIPSVAGAVDFWLQDGGELLEGLRLLLRRLGVAH